MASSLKADTRIYSQGIRNLNDGVSALNIADGALSNLSSIVVRIEELAEQAANGSVGWQQRKSLDAEAQALAKEYFRISRTTEFNDLKLFDGSIQDLSLQAGYGSDGSISSSIGGALGTGTFKSAVSYQTAISWATALSIADVNGDGLSDLVTIGNSGGGGGYANIRLGNGDGSFKASLSYLTDEDSSEAVILSDINSDGTLDILTTGAGSGSGSATIRLGNGDGTFRASGSFESQSGIGLGLSIADVNGDGLLDLATAGGGGAAIWLGNGDGNFRASRSYETESTLSQAISLCDVNSDGMTDLVTAGWGDGSGAATIRLGNGDASFRASLSYDTEAVRSYALSTSDINGDGFIDLVTAGRGWDDEFSMQAGTASIRFGNGDGTFQESLTWRTESSESRAISVTDVNGDGSQDLITAGNDGVRGRATIRLGNGDGSFKKGTVYTTESTVDASSYAVYLSDLNGDGVQDLATAGGYGGGYTTIRLANTKAGLSPILPFSLKTQADALQAIPMLKRTLERLSVQRGQIGGFQSRLTSALQTMSCTVLQYKGAQSRVEDADIASESASLVRQQILQQTSSSVLAQANQGPALALMLLRG